MIRFYTCKNGHEWLLWKECPFCTALKNLEPEENDEKFLEIYHYLKGKNESEIENIYRAYLPSEPEICLMNPQFD